MFDVPSPAAEADVRVVGRRFKLDSELGTLPTLHSRYGPGVACVDSKHSQNRQKYYQKQISCEIYQKQISCEFFACHANFL